MFKIRPGKPTDLGFVVETMVRKLLPAYKTMPRDQYWTWMKARANRLAGRSDIIVACAKDDEDTILGWLMLEKRCIHFVYVRPDVRQSFGVEDALLKYVTGADCYSHKTLKELKKLPWRPDLAE